MSQRTLNFSTGTTTISGQTNSFSLASGSVFHVPSGGTLLFDKDGGFTNNQGIFNGGGGTATIANDGVIRKVAGNTGNTFFGIAQNISATGHFEVLSGTINVNAGGSSTGGTFLATSPGVFNFASSFTFDAATSLTGTGDYIFSGGNFTVTGTYNVSGDTNINGGSVAFNSTPTINTLHLLSGTLTGSANFAPTGLFTWTGGQLVGTATPNATFTIGAGGVDFNGSNVNGTGHFMSQRTLNFATGTTAISGQTNSFSLASGAVFHVPSGGTLLFDKDGGFTNNQGIFNGGGAASTIANDGIIRKVAGNTGNTFFGIAQNISATGHFEVLSGTINVNSGGASTGGTFLATAPGVFNFASSFTFDAATSMTGTGDYIFSGGSFTVTGTYNVSGDTNISGGSVAFNSTPTINTLHLLGGNVTGTANLAPTGLFTWTSGQLLGTATPNATFTIGAGGVDFNGSNVNGTGHFMSQRNLNFATGTTTISGQTNSFSLASGSVFHVPSGGTLVFDKDGGFTNNQGIFNGGGAASTIANDGIIRKVAGNTGNTFFGIAQNISATGHFEVLSGTINVNSGGASTGGTFLATLPGVFNFGSSFTFDAATSMTGTGDYIFSGGNFTIAGTYNVSGDTNISGGSVAFNSTPTINTLHLLSGNVTGTANLAPTGLFTWTSGQLLGTATPNATFTIGAGGVDFNGSNVNGVSHFMSQRTLNLAPVTTTVSGQTSNFSLASGAVFHVPSGGTLLFDKDGGFSNNQGFFNGGGAASSLSNDGIIRKVTGNTGNTFFGTTTNNTGTFEILSGSAALIGNFNQTGGILRVNGGVITGNGNVTIQGGTMLGVDSGVSPGYTSNVTNSGGIVHPGLSPGILSIVGPYTQTASGSFNVDINGTTAGSGYSQLNITGAATLNGTLNVTLGGGFSPSAGNTFTVMNFSSHTGDFSALNVPPLSGGLVWTKTVTATSVILTVNPPSVPDLTITKTHTGNFTQGQTGATYTITVANAGTGPSSGTVTVVDTLPASLTATALSGTGWSCTLGTLTCTRSDALTNGSSYPAITLTVNVSNTAPASVTNSVAVSGGGETNTGNDSASDLTTINSLPDLALAIGDAPDPVIAGNNLTYTITVTNNGGSAASAATVSDTLPSGVSLVSVASSQGACTALPCNLGTINPTASATVTVTVKVAAATRGTLSNTASVAETQTDANNANNSATASTTVNASADLSITNGAAPSPVAAGTNLTYTMVVSNAGPSTATNASVSSTLPAGTSFTATGSTAGCGAAAQVVTCSAGTIAPGGTVTITVVAAVAAATRGALADTATVTATETDPNNANNSATANTTATGSADLVVTKSGSPNPVVVGNNVTFTITVTNNGPSQATAVTATDTLPANITFVSATLTQGTCTPPASGAVNCTIGTINPGASVTATVVITPTATGALSNSVSVAGTETDPNNTNNSATANITVNPAQGADFTVQSPSSVNVVQGQNGLFIVTLTPVGGFNQAITVTCTVDTITAACNPALPSVTLDGTHSAGDAITVTTMKGGMTPNVPDAPVNPLDILRLILLCAVGLLAMLALRAMRQRRWANVTGFAAIAILAGVLFAGCASGGGTPKGPHQMTITGKTASGTTHTASVVLNVQ